MSSALGWPDPDSPRDQQQEVKPWLRDLSPAQREAVAFADGSLLVIAGAGSGKTRTLAMRVADLVGNGADPSRILLLTFTRRAAQEMLARASAAIGSEDISAIWGGTFHAVCHKLLRHIAPAIGLHPAFSLIDQADAVDLMATARTAVVENPSSKNRFPGAATLLDIYGRVASSQDSVSEVLSRHFPWCQSHREAVIDIFKEYADHKTRLQVLDFDDLLLYMHAAARSKDHSHLLNGLFDHVLVDEFQDVNPLEAEIVKALSRGCSSLMAVGDDAQAIFGFRGADARAMTDFSGLYPKASEHYLCENYRSTPQVLAVANSVMSGAKAGYSKELFSSRDPGPMPILHCCADESAQSIEVCDLVLAEREAGVALRDQAVLFRTAHHSGVLEIELRRRDIPFVKYGGLKFLEASHVRDFLALLRLAGNPRDELALTRVIGLIPGAGEARVERAKSAIRESAEGDHLHLIEAACDAILPLPADGNAVLIALREALLAADRQSDEGSNGQVRVTLGVEAEALGRFCREAFPFRYGNPEARLADIDSLCAVAAQSPSRADFIADLTLDPPASTSDFAGPPHLDDDYLILSTIHSAKGGEWDSVYLIHAADGCIPSDMAIGTEDGVEEERRLAYVAVTRARRALHVLYPLRFHHNRFRKDDAHSMALLSRFFVDALDAFDRDSTPRENAGRAGTESAQESSEILSTGLAELWV